MKKCLQCGNKFDDKFSFCPECGQQLVADNSCPQCGAEIAPGAKFCPNCGARLAPQAAPQAAPAPQQPAPAPAPAPQPAPAPAPAPAPVYAAPQPAPQQRPAKQKGEVLQKVLRFVYLGLFCLFSFLFLLGMFGDPFQANAMGYTQTQSISYFFGEGMEPFSDVTTASQGFGMFMTILYMLSYFGALIGLCICIPIGIVKVTKAVKAKAPIDTKMLSGMVVSVVPYLFLTGAIAFAKVSAYGAVEQTEFGWGTTMIFVMVILSIVTMTVYKVFGGKLNVKEIIANSLCGVGYLAAVLMAVFSNTLLVSISQYGATRDMTPYMFVINTIDAADAFELFPILMMGFLLSLVSAGLMIGSINAPKSRRLGRVIPMLVISSVLNITACVLCSMAMQDYQGSSEGIIPGVSVGSIMTIVLFIVELGCVIAAVSVAKPSNPAPMQPQPQPLPQPQDPNQGYRG